MKKLMIVLSLLALPLTALAEGRILGRVVDQNGDAQAEVTVRIAQGKTFWQGAITNDAGFFRLEDVPAGEYSIAAYAKGKIRTWYGSIITNDATTRYDIEVHSLEPEKPEVAKKKTNE
ncbi:hypothetical protein Ctha_1476 [Chloroherpeton thalassium ATCC 35110]|uniref:Carboxypeptidase regulatory-like domain-containing protein n=1 Tax=Chloroherpeton thalassium (strain ATCC 35110 / GB-78) TaxID=517418 RepID=B3QRY2_CHLT3|nr:carboxypeptidase-like regulatory domain-containing protein [Chloroherpeton thalassium]ACF13935.1 hypothetical protein Ctha_1476 [Chloroherpeton thalassium ATCC 35110]